MSTVYFPYSQIISSLGNVPSRHAYVPDWSDNGSEQTAPAQSCDNVISEIYY